MPRSGGAAGRGLRAPAWPVLSHPEGRSLILALTDEVLRIRDPERAAAVLRGLARDDIRQTRLGEAGPDGPDSRRLHRFGRPLGRDPGRAAAGPHRDVRRHPARVSRRLARHVAESAAGRESG